MLNAVPHFYCCCYYYYYYYYYYFNNIFIDNKANY